MMMRNAMVNGIQGRRIGFLRLIAAGAIWIAIASPSSAESIPDAGSVLRSTLQPDSSLRLQQDVPEIIQPEREPTQPVGSDVRFTISSLRISGNSRFSDSELLALLGDIPGANRSLGTLEMAAARITQHYREQGYLATWAYVPAQDIKKDGIVEIAVLEGRLGRIMLENGSRTADAVLHAYLAPERLGSIIDEHALDRAFLLLRDVTQADSPTAVLRPGTKSGTTDMTVRVGSVPPLSGTLEVDNYGLASTGRIRVGGMLHWNNPAGIGDNFEAKLMTSAKGQDYARVAYGLPFGGSGARLHLAYLDSRYKLGGPFAELDALGNASIWTASAIYPFIRSKHRNLYGELSLDHKRLHDEVGATSTVSDKKNDVISISLTGDHYAQSGSLTAFSARIDAGKLQIESPAMQVNDAASARTNGHYLKLSYALAHYQPVVPDTLLLLSASGQVASKNLDSAEKMSIGGPFGVRAFPAGEAAGDAGYIAAVELRYKVAQQFIPGDLTLVGFIDAGMVRVNVNPFMEGSNKRRLTGIGIGALLYQASGVDWRLFYAARIRHASSNVAGKGGRAGLQARMKF